MTQETARHRADVEQLRRRFEEYRSSHAVRSRLPEELWAAAGKLARRDGIEATARALEVDRPSLQKWTDRFERGAQPKPGKVTRPGQPRRRGQATPGFVELLAQTTGTTLPGTTTSWLVEVESPRGGRLRLEVKAIPTSELAELIRALAVA